MYAPWLNKAKRVIATSVRPLPLPAVLDNGNCYSKAAAHFG
jgi:hypothetical protein